jgi:orotate phosphoribosyltransferase/AMMECR1 domain-containing protein
LTQAERLAAARTELLEMLRADAVLRSTPDAPVLAVDGSVARWMLDSLSVSLSARGLELAGRCLLELLSRFEGRHIATYGLIGVPLLSSCVLLSGGRYRGLIVRKERKPYGSRRIIEGKLEPDEPVILLDDSIRSGRATFEGIRHLEAAGLWVEGAVCLVRFGWGGGVAALQERGYHVEALYDVWEDFTEHLEGEEKLVRNLTKDFPLPEAWGPEHAPEGLHPARLARLGMERFLETGRLILPPKRLDHDYDGAGGVWISVRLRSDLDERPVREGFVHFPGEPAGPVPRDLVLAAYKAALRLSAGDAGRRILDEGAVAVTFCSALEECTVGELDNERYGIVVASRERPGWMGGALPRMPRITGEWRQFEHARTTNGKLLPQEPFVLYRHSLVKAVEPGAAWQPHGVPAGEGVPGERDPQVCGRLAGRARDLLLERLGLGAGTSVPLPGGLVPESLEAFHLHVFARGRLVAELGGGAGPAEETLSALADRVGSEPRLVEALGASGPEAIAVTVSLLYAPKMLGEVEPREVMLYVRHGQQALQAYRGSRSGLLLPFLAAMGGLGPQDYVEEVLDRAGLRKPPFQWCRYDCVTWLADAAGARLLEGPLPVGSPPGSLEEALDRFAPLLAGYLLRQQREDGTLCLRYEPFHDELTAESRLPWLAQGAWALARAHRVLGGEALGLAARRAIAYLLGTLVKDSEGGLWLQRAGEPSSITEVAMLLLALCELPRDVAAQQQAEGLARSLWACVGRHGRFRTQRDESLDEDGHQDYAPGQALLALARSREAGFCEAEPEALSRAFRFYRHRFRFKRHWGPVSWQAQAFAAWARTARAPEHASFVFEIVDWALSWQQETGGGFVNDDKPDPPNAMTAVYLEGLAAAFTLAGIGGDAGRMARYRDACERALRFIDRLVLQERDAALLPAPERALGGLRQGPGRATVRTDLVQHALSAVLELREAVSAKTP